MKRRSGIKVMGQLIGLVVPLLHVMTAAILLGVAGFLCAIFLSIRNYGKKPGRSFCGKTVWTYGRIRSLKRNSALCRAGLQSLYCF